MHHLDGLIKHPLAHKVGIKLAGGRVAVMRRQLRRQRRRPIHVQTETAP